MSTDFFSPIHIFPSPNISKILPELSEKYRHKSEGKNPQKEGSQSSKISLRDKERKGFIGQATEGRCLRQMLAVLRAAEYRRQHLSGSGGTLRW